MREYSWMPTNHCLGRYCPAEKYAGINAILLKIVRRPTVSGRPDRAGRGWFLEALRLHRPPVDDLRPGHPGVVAGQPPFLRHRPTNHAPAARVVRDLSVQLPDREPGGGHLHAHHIYRFDPRPSACMLYAFGSPCFSSWERVRRANTLFAVRRAPDQRSAPSWMIRLGVYKRRLQATLGVIDRLQQPCSRLAAIGCSNSAAGLTAGL